MGPRRAASTAMASDDFDAIVIGAGEAGELVARLAGDAGHRVVMVYRERYGGTCLNDGCVPSKFLIDRAKVAHLVRAAGRLGIHADAPHVDLASIVAEKKCPGRAPPARLS